MSSSPLYINAHFHDTIFLYTIVIPDSLLSAARALHALCNRYNLCIYYIVHGYRPICVGFIRRAVVKYEYI